MRTCFVIHIRTGEPNSNKRVRMEEGEDGGPH